MIIDIKKPKTFGDIGEQDLVYLLRPETGNVVETKVRSTKVLKSNGRLSVLEIEIYKLTAMESITTEKMELAKEEYNTEICWRIRVFNHLTLGPVHLPRMAVPTIISADKIELLKWMTRTGPRVMKKNH